MRLFYCLWLGLSWLSTSEAQDRRWLQAAADCARYLEARVLSEPGAYSAVWSASDRPKVGAAFNLYAGMPAGVLLLNRLQALRSPVGDDLHDRALTTLLDQVRANGSLDWGQKQGPQTGLYTGSAGLLWLFLELHDVPETPPVDDQVRAIVRGLRRSIKKDGADGGHWETGTDIISGAAGTGLALLHAHEKLQTPGALKLATAAGHWLVRQGIPDGDGTKWKMRPESARSYPNFSHGTAGVGYFLGRLFAITKDNAFLDAARSAAVSLDSRRITTEQGCAWYHHEGDGEDLVYVSWCHGPPGTTRLYEQLFQITGEDAYRQRVLEGASWLIATGIPTEPKADLSGYWNDGTCCGDAGIGEFYCDLYTITEDKRWLAAATHIAKHLLAKASPEPEGTLAWLQAEHRVRPLDKCRQTGWAQGSAGIGLFFLRLHLLTSGSGQASWCYADSPFPLT